jgi:hypothetical protein
VDQLEPRVDRNSENKSQIPRQPNHIIQLLIARRFLLE